MFKSLTLSLSLVLALSLTGVSKAGVFHKDGGCATCGIASPQGPVVSPQSVVASPQGDCGSPTCAKGCGGLGFLKKCGGAMSGFGSKCGGALTGMGHDFGDLCKKLKPKPACYTYEWVLKKKRVHGGCGAPSCETCGPAVTPSAQVSPTSQSYVAPYAAPQAYGTGQAAAYGSGQYTASAAGMMSPAAAPAPAPRGGDEAPPAPEVAPPAPVGPQSSLLFSTPSGN